MERYILEGVTQLYDKDLGSKQIRIILQNEGIDLNERNIRMKRKTWEELIGLLDKELEKNKWDGGDMLSGKNSEKDKENKSNKTKAIIGGISLTILILLVSVSNTVGYNSKCNHRSEELVCVGIYCGNSVHVGCNNRNIRI